MNRGAAVARGGIYLFLHADTQLPVRRPVEVRRALSLPRVAGGAFELGIDSPGKAYRLIEAMVSLRYPAFQAWPTATRPFLSKAACSIAWEDTAEIPLMEDVELMRRVKRTRQRIVILGKRVKTSPRRWEKEGVVFCTLRNWALVTLYLMGWRPEVLVKYYREG